MFNIGQSALYDQESFYQAFLRDLGACRHSLIIESPFITEKRIATLFPALLKSYGDAMCVLSSTRVALSSIAMVMTCKH